VAVPRLLLPVLHEHGDTEDQRNIDS
jgi:hypothetical protein